MTTIALFHSVLGVRQGIHDAADIFRYAGHDVHVIDQYEGKVFDDYDEAGAHAAAIGYPDLMQAAISAVTALPLPLVAAGFSNGAGHAEYVTAALGGKAAGLLGSLQFSGALPLDELGLGEWPADTPVQLHYAADDPFRDEEWITPFVAAVEASGSACEQYLEYPVAGHLFTDKSMTAEFDPDAAGEAFARALEFVERLGRTA